MISRAAFWKIQAIGIFGLWGSFLVFTFTIHYVWPILVLLIVHAMELIVVGWSIGRNHQYSKVKTVIYCLFYGYVWWVPVKRGIY